MAFLRTETAVRDVVALAKRGRRGLEVRVKAEPVRWLHHDGRAPMGAAGRSIVERCRHEPLGTGVITTALKKNRARPESLAAAVAAMTTLNQAAATALQEVGAKLTDSPGGGSILGATRLMKVATRLYSRAFLCALLTLPAVGWSQA